MQEDFAPAELLLYPSLTSVLLQSDQAWQLLPVGRDQPLEPPVVELLD